MVCLTVGFGVFSVDDTHAAISASYVYKRNYAISTIRLVLDAACSE